MANWGLIDSATASGPQDYLAQVLAQAQADDEAKFKRAGEVQAREINLRKVADEEAQTGVKSGDLTLRNNERTDKITQAKQKEDAYQALLNDPNTPQYLKITLKAQHDAGTNITPLEASMSPADLHTQQQADAVTVATRAAKAKADEEAAQLKNSITLKGSPSYEDLHKPKLMDDPFMTPGPTVQQGGSPTSVMGGFRPISGGGNAAATTAPASGSASATPQIPNGLAAAPTPTTAPSTPAPAQPQANPNGQPDEQFLASLPQSSRMRVKAISDGTYPIPARGAITDPGLSQDIQRAMRYDPSLDLSTYQMRADTRKKFASGDPAQQVQNLNTAIAHMAAIDHSVDSLGNFSGIATPLNYVKNFFTTPDVKNFEQDRDRLGSEINNVYEKGGGAESDREATRGTFGKYDSKNVQQSAIAESVKLLKGKIDALDNEYKKGMNGSRFSISDMLSPEARTAYDSLVKKYGGTSSESSAPNEIHYDMQGNRIK